MPEKNTDAFLAKIPEYAAQVVRAFTLNFQGGQPGYRGAINSACEADGALRKDYAGRVGRVIEGCDAQGVLEGAADDPLVHAKMKALAAKKG